MSQPTPYIGEIRIWPCNFAPAGWAFCNGATVAIAQNEALFNLIGTTYGGDGQQTFLLPDLQGRAPVHVASTNFTLGQQGGTETVTLTTNQIPGHGHLAQANNAGTAPSPSGAVWASWTGTQYSDQAPAATMNAAAIQNAGGSQPHENMVPFLTLNFIIALIGTYPSPT